MSLRFSTLVLAVSLILAAGNAWAQCDPNGFTTDPTDFAGLPTEDFENTGLPEFMGSPTLTLAGFVLTAIPAGEVALFPPFGAALPLDSFFIGTLSLGVRVEPQGAGVDRLGLKYGTQASTSMAEVETSDGMVRTFNFAGDPVTGGTAGFFGYDSCDPAITIVRVDVMLNADGGIDDVQCLGCGEAVEMTGACCSLFECAETTEAACEGVYRGDGSSCEEPDVCGTAPEGTICHIPPGNPSKARTLTVGFPAVQAHLGHGDTLGPCPGDTPEPGTGESVKSRRDAKVDGPDTRVRLNR